MILIGGAMSFRKFKKFEQIATALSKHCTVINYDRRGRGDSGPAGPVSVQHEVDDLAALIDAVGGRASLWGWSSGGAVALRAAAADVGVEKLVLYETPFKTDPQAKYRPRTTAPGSTKSWPRATRPGPPGTSCVTASACRLRSSR